MSNTKIKKLTKFEKAISTIETQIEEIGYELDELVENEENEDVLCTVTRVQSYLEDTREDLQSLFMHKLNGKKK